MVEKPIEPAPFDPKKDPNVKLDHLLTDGHEHNGIAQSQPDAARSSTSTSTLDAIPQQYKVATEPDQSASHQIFDTKEYHNAPMNGHDAPPYRGNTLLIVSIILLTLAVVGAVAIYFYGEQLGL